MLGNYGTETRKPQQSTQPTPLTFEQLPDDVKLAFQRAHNKSLTNLPSKLELVIQSLIFSGFSGLAYFAFRASGAYAADGFYDIFNIKITAVDDVLEALALVPPMVLSANSGRKLVVALYDNRRDLATINTDYREGPCAMRVLEYTIDVTGALTCATLSFVASGATAYIANHHLEGTGVVPEDWVSTYVRCAQVSAFNTNSLLSHRLAAAPIAQRLQEALRARIEPDQLQRAVLLALLQDFQAELPKMRKDGILASRKIVKLYEALRDLNTKNKPEHFIQKFQLIIQFWLDNFFKERLHIAGKEKTTLFEWKTFITALIAGVYSLPNFMAGDSAETFAKEFAFFGLFIPGKVIGGSSFLLNWLINTSALNSLVNSLHELYQAKKGGYRTPLSGGDIAKLITTSIINLAFVASQTGIAAAFPALTFTGGKEIQTAVTAISALGLGNFSLNTAVNSGMTYLRTFAWRNELAGNVSELIQEGNSAEGIQEGPQLHRHYDIAALCSNQIEAMVSALVYQTRRLPTPIITNLSEILDEHFKAAANATETNQRHHDKASSSQQKTEALERERGLITSYSDGALTGSALSVQTVTTPQGGTIVRTERHFPASIPPTLRVEHGDNPYQQSTGQSDANRSIMAQESAAAPPRPLTSSGPLTHFYRQGQREVAERAARGCCVRQRRHNSGYESVQP